METDPTSDFIARTPDQIGAAIRRHRRKHHRSQAEVGKQAGMRQATVSALEIGAPGSGVGTLCDLLLALDLELVVRPRTKVTADNILDLY